MIQRLLRPVHDWAMTVLRRLPTDGTFYQTRPLDLLKGKQVCYSSDLKSATDRFPMMFMEEVVFVSPLHRKWRDELIDLSDPRSGLTGLEPVIFPPILIFLPSTPSNRASVAIFFYALIERRSIQ